MSDPRIEQLSHYLAQAERSTPATFWAGWYAIAGDLPDLVWSDAATPELREAFTELLEAADDAGWAVPCEQMQP